MSGYCPDCGNTLCMCDEITKATYLYRCKIEELEQKLSLAEGEWKAYYKANQDLSSKLGVAVEALEKCKKIRRKDGNDNEYEGAESIIANEALAKINQK